MMQAALHRRARWLPRSLCARLVLILAGVGLVTAIAIAMLMVVVITPSFDKMESDVVAAQRQRAEAVLLDFAAKAETSARDAADTSIANGTMSAPGIDGIAFLDKYQRATAARWIGGDAGDEGKAMRARMLAALARIDLGAALKTSESRSFYICIGDQVAVIGAARVRAGIDGTTERFVVAARLLTADMLGESLQRKIVIAAPMAGVAPPAEDGYLRAAIPLPGADGQPVATASFDIPRDLAMLGRRMLMFAVGGSILLLAIVFAVLRRTISILVFKPLQRIENHMQQVRASGALTMLMEDRREDEIGSLITSLNLMLSQLKDLREQVAAQSFALGRSDHAAAMIHNVRNALNPVSTILSQGVLRPGVVDRPMLDRAIAELARDDVSAARRQKLAAFVTASADAAAVDRDERRRQLVVGREAIRDVIEIIGCQHAPAQDRPTLAACNISELVARSAAIARYSGDRSITFSFPALPFRAMANRVILSQVVGNIFANAAEAIAAKGVTPGNIAVSISVGNGLTRIRITDDGEGFDPTFSARLFQRGYSTRSHKSGGLGLHWCANAMNAMGGMLEIESDGPGSGARVVLTLATAEVWSEGIAA
ncbi:sensor histidine kinase [Sphingomonas sp. 37zxx]|uniref:sensor histidine kinase n=1 Tax=Sphingomonas sp. 37zxx TaxID=1550073 RepID=UPI000690D74A|nr:HAMP domain-containing sensor histidine kinase [Sphingomonas sp. 37zxx]